MSVTSRIRSSLATTAYRTTATTPATARASARSSWLSASRTRRISQAARAAGAAAISGATDQGEDRPQGQGGQRLLQPPEGDPDAEHVRQGVAQRQPGRHQRCGVQRDHHADADDHVRGGDDDLDEERGPGVLQRVEGAQADVLEGERHQPDAERHQRVAGELPVLGARRRSRRSAGRSADPRTTNATEVGTSTERASRIVRVVSSATPVQVAGRGQPRGARQHRRGQRDGDQRVRQDPDRVRVAVRRQPAAAALRMVAAVATLLTTISASWVTST